MLKFSKNSLFTMFLIPYTKRLFAVCWGIPFILLTTLAACGGGGSNSEAPIQINTAPQLTGLIDFAIDENTTEITTIQATDAEGDNITYSIEGSDSALMTIGSLSGELSFISPPDFENQQDSNQDNIYEVTIIASDGSLSSSLGIIITINDILEGMGGSTMLLMGNSFFRPYAEKLDEIAIDAGFLEHKSTIVNRGGENGRAINFWNDSTSEEHILIKSKLDQGDIDFFGMTSGSDSENRIEGFKAWIEYALQNNPNITVFISIAPFDFPNGDPNGTRPNWDIFALDNGFSSIQEMFKTYINDIQHNEIVDQLRIEFPSTKIFTIPTGWSTFNLYQMKIDDLLSDEINMFGPRETSIFTDEKGHQGDIIRETGGLVWLNSIYGVHLITNDYDTGFYTDLHTIAENIMALHDPDYKQQ